MSLSDLATAPLRRWYATVPLLLLSLGLVSLFARSLRPEYDASGHVLLVPPSVSNGRDLVGRPASAHNPWADLGLSALGQAAVVKVQDQRTLEGLAVQGYTSHVTLTVGIRTPVVTIEAVGESARRVAGTVVQIEKLLAGEVARAQTRYGVATEDLITVLSLDDDVNVRKVTSNVVRAVAGAAGGGLFLTAAGIMMVDALLRRRARRRVAVVVGRARVRHVAAPGAPGMARRSAPAVGDRLIGDGSRNSSSQVP